MGRFDQHCNCLRSRSLQLSQKLTCKRHVKTVLNGTHLDLSCMELGEKATLALNIGQQGLLVRQLTSMNDLCVCGPPIVLQLIGNVSSTVQYICTNSCLYFVFVCCRVCPYVHFCKVYMSSPTFPTFLEEFATKGCRKKGLALLDAAAMAELCPIMVSASTGY